MDRLSRVRIVFFSGTGCTALVVESFRRELEARGSSVQMQELRHGSPEPEGGYDFLILCFAVHACTAPHPVRHWAKRHRPVQGIPAAVISVSGGGDVTPNLACRVTVNRLLSRKGFRVDYEKMLVMPSNWIVPTKPAVAARLLEVLPEKVAAVIDELSSGVRRRSRPGPGNRLLSLLGKCETAGAHRFGKKIRVDGSCSGCGLCALRCPAGNIAMDGGKPVFGSGCILCLACLYGCPRKSLSPGVMKFILIPGGFDVKKIASAVPPSGPLDLEKEIPGFLWLGVRRYLLEPAGNDTEY